MSEAEKEETKEGEPASIPGKKDPDGEASRNSSCEHSNMYG